MDASTTVSDYFASLVLLSNIDLFSVIVIFCEEIIVSHTAYVPADVFVDSTSC